MKKVLFCLVAVAAFAFASCGDDTKENPADAYAGTYTITGMAHLNGVPVIGTYDTQIPESEVTITPDGETGNVTITMNGTTATGYVNESGMHIDPVIVNTNILSTDVEITVAIPVIGAPVDGVITTTANLTATIMGMAITGTADITATKK